MYREVHYSQRGAQDRPVWTTRDRNAVDQFFFRACLEVKPKRGRWIDRAELRLWGSLVGPEGTLIVGLLGGVAGAAGADKLVQTALGG